MADTHPSIARPKHRRHATRDHGEIVRRLMGLVARLASAALLTLGLLLMPGGAASTVVAKSTDCPPPPVTVAKLVHLDVPGHQCYGSRVLVFRAFVAPPCDECGGVSATVIAPRWLDGLEGSSVNLSAVAEGPQIAAYVPPALGRCHLTNDSACPFHRIASNGRRSRRATTTVAQTCHYADKPAGGGAATAVVAESADCPPGPDSNPVTDAVAAPAADSVHEPAAPAWLLVFGVASVLLLVRRPVVGRR